MFLINFWLSNILISEKNDLSWKGSSYKHNQAQLQIYKNWMNKDFLNYIKSSIL